MANGPTLKLVPFGSDSLTNPKITLLGSRHRRNGEAVRAGHVSHEQGLEAFFGDVGSHGVAPLSDRPDLSDWSDPSDFPSNGLVPLQSGYPLQPQKGWPAWGPR